MVGMMTMVRSVRYAFFLLFVTLCVADFVLAAPPAMHSADAAKAHGWAIAIHGGAGESEWEHMDAATASAYHDSLAKALAAGSAVLKAHGKALDAVEAAVKVLEDDPLFNAGRGSAFAADGKNEMDAAIMDGATLGAGSVADVEFTRHPISLARAVMEHTPYVMMVGPGADEFSRAQGLEQQPASFFFTEMRWQEFAAIVRASGRSVPPRAGGRRTGTYGCIGAAWVYSSLWNGGSGGSGRRGTSGRGYFYGWDAGQDAGACWRLSADWGWHVCKRSLVRCIRHGCWRVFHPAYAGPAGLYAGGAGTNAAAGCRPDDSHGATGAEGRRGRRDCDDADRRAGVELEHAGDVSRQGRRGQRA